MSRKTLKTINMKKTKSFLSFLMFVLFFAVLSCDEQDDKMETRIPAQNLDGTDKIVGRSGTPDYDGSEGDPLDKSIAKAWVTNFKSASAKTGSAEEIRSHYFGRDIIETLLNESGAVGIRIYYALDSNGEKKLLLVGVDASGEDLLPLEGGKSNDGGNIIADFSFPCPNTCPENGL
jgi:hypothetical protein